MGMMGSAQPITHVAADCEEVCVRITTDPPGRVETPGIARPRVAIHLGKSVYMACERARLKHRGEDSPDGYPQTSPYKWWNWHDNYGAEASPDPQWVKVSDAGVAAFRKADGEGESVKVRFKGGTR